MQYAFSSPTQIGIDTLGESAPAEALYEYFNLTPAHVAQCAMNLIVD